MERNCQPFFDFSNMAQQNLSFETILSTPHLNLSAHTFTVYTLPSAQRLSTLLRHRIAQQLPQQIHNTQQLDCRHCRLCHQWPTPFQWPSQPINSSSSSSSSPSFSLARSCYWWMPPYPRQSDLIPSTSTSVAGPTLFPTLTTRSSWVYPRTYFMANAADCLHRLQTIPEERQWGTATFLIVVEDPEAEDNIFQCYYHWFINEGCD